MPCGGIYPAVQREGTETCFLCQKPISEDRYYECIEWDCSLHVKCLDPFLTTIEGKIVLMHEHEVVRWEDEEKTPKMVDISKVHVEITIRGDGRVLWVNTEHGCVLRICDIQGLEILDERR